MVEGDMRDLYRATAVICELAVQCYMPADDDVEDGKDSSSVGEVLSGRPPTKAIRQFIARRVVALK